MRNVVKASDRIEVVRCKNCKYFELDSWGVMAGWPEPIIVAHEICSRWGEGCKTNPDGYCFMGESAEKS